MRLGLQLGYDDPAFWVGLAEEAERCGFDSVWTSEAYGSDAVSPLAWIGGRTERIKLGTAIMQMPARSPATTAATAATLDLLSGGRTLLGLGTSGPQVAEGWHGQAWGKPLKIIVHPPRADVPIYLAAIGPKNVALAAEIADGWLPIFFSPERFAETHLPMLEEGFARRGGRPGGWDLAAHVPVVLTDDADVQVARDFLKPLLALYVGGMGAEGQNFYTRLAERYGYADAAATVQDLYLAGKKNDAIAAVPDALVDEVALVGGRDRIAERVAAFRDCGVTTLVLQARQPEALRLLAELVA